MTAGRLVSHRTQPADVLRLRQSPAGDDVVRPFGPPASPSGSHHGQGDPPPCLAPGLEFLGEYQSSGALEAPHLVRRADGGMVSIPRLLFLLASDIDGRRDIGSLATRLSVQLGRSVSPDNVRFLIHRKLVPARIVHDGPQPSERAHSDTVLGVHLRGAIVPPRVVEGAAAVLMPLFWPPVIVAVVAGFVGFDAWLLLTHGVGRGVGQMTAVPAVMVLAYAVLLLCAAFHELGHAAAGRYGGARPGRIGVGLYLIWPAFFSDMTDTYRLSRAGRLRTDLGGVYFNAVFILACAATYGVTGFEPILAMIVMQHVLVVMQFLPFLRLDGYYIVSDLIGVPDRNLSRNLRRFVSRSSVRHFRSSAC